MLYAQVHLTLPAWVHQEVDHQKLYTDETAQMELAIQLSAMNIHEQTGGPFGAALFSGSGRLLGIGVNRVIESKCSSAHAEMMAFATAQQRIQQYRLNEMGERVTLASSSQPCAMCYGASFWAGIDHILIGARSEDVQTLAGFDEGPLPSDWVGEWQRRGISVKCDLLREQACAVLQQYGESGLVY